VQTFRTNGPLSFIIEAPECFYDESRKAINSLGQSSFELPMADSSFPASASRAANQFDAVFSNQVQRLSFQSH